MNKKSKPVSCPPKVEGGFTQEQRDKAQYLSRRIIEQTRCNKNEAMGAALEYVIQFGTI